MEGKVALYKEYLCRFQGTVTVFIMTQMYKYLFSLEQISSCYIRQRQIDNRATIPRDALSNKFCYFLPSVSVNSHLYYKIYSPTNSTQLYGWYE